MGDLPRRAVSVARSTQDPRIAVEAALEGAGVLARIGPDTRVALKPNLTYPVPRPGVTTTPELFAALAEVIRRRTRHVVAVESDGGYGAWSADAAFDGHGFPALARDIGFEVVNLSKEASEPIEYRARGRVQRLPLPKRLLHDTDLLISVPVPKVHSMTRVSLALKNQWGCIPDDMRMRNHHLFEEAVLAIDLRLRPAVLADGTWFLDDNGPMEGTPVRMDLVIGASDAGSFDRYVSELMGFDWQRIPHLRRAAQRGSLPARLDSIRADHPPSAFGSHRFSLRRTPRNWIALAGFRSRFLTWFGYESWFGRVVLHKLLYAVVGEPVKLEDGR
ncbi:MAG TPA: DUF362 domain-containing protein [Longimicrobiales bacterium]|nr:DUF362 domain-containing protein [Longimicrobiales bacterium]